ncbi:hypothetical protein BVX98_06355 [bacterium F11]|nr:hypothetical protein BVX98_06355 [bacterium F11]
MLNQVHKVIGVLFCLFLTSTLGIRIQAEDVSAEIDFATFFNLGENSVLTAIQADNEGNVLIVGSAYYDPLRYPTAHRIGPPESVDNQDIVLSKINKDGTDILWMTFIGGRRADYPTGIKLLKDLDGSILLTGQTTSPDFPTTNNAVIPRPPPVEIDDGVVVRLSENGSQLLYSTYFGGSDADQVLDATMDVSGNIFVVGKTHSHDMPNPQNSLKGISDGFVSVIDHTGSNVVFTEYIGTEEDDLLVHGEKIEEIEINPWRRAYFLGSVFSDGLETTEDALYKNHQGNEDLFIGEISAFGQIHYLSYYGGSEADATLGHSMEVDPFGNIYVSGVTLSQDFPLYNAHQTDYINEKNNGFLFKINSLNNLSFSTYIGGEALDFCTGITVDSFGRIFVSGVSVSSDFELTPGAIKTELNGNSRTFIQTYSPRGNLLYSSFFGGSQYSHGLDIDLGLEEQPILFGVSNETDFPVTPGVINSPPGPFGQSEYVAKINLSNFPSPLISSKGIDVDLVFSSYFDVGGFDPSITAVKSDEDGSIYIGGHVYWGQDSIPDNARHFGPLGFMDFFIAKMSSDGSTLHWLNLIGGSGTEFSRNSEIIIGQDKSISFFGDSSSDDFPITDQALFSSNRKSDGVLFRFNSKGSKLLYSSYFGGSQNDGILNMAQDTDGNWLVSGYTQSPDLPQARNSFGGGLSDGFVTKISSDGTQVLFSKYFGGSDTSVNAVEEYIYDVVIDSNNNIYLAGGIYSEGMPTTMNAFSRQPIGENDAYFAKLSSTGDLLYGTYFGGTKREDFNFNLARDNFGNIYLVGATYSDDYPTTENASQPQFGGVSDGFISKWDPNMNLVYLTYVGGYLDDELSNLAIDSTGNIFVIGDMESPDMKVTTDAFQTDLKGYGDSYLRIYGPNGHLLYSTYFGGTNSDYGNAIDLNHRREVTMVGFTNSEDYPTTPGSHQQTNETDNSGFITKVSASGVPDGGPQADAGPDQDGIIDSLGDDVVDVSDFNIWNENKFKTENDPERNDDADMNGDGEINEVDFQIWFDAKFTEKGQGNYDKRADINGRGLEKVCLDGTESVGNNISYEWFEDEILLAVGPTPCLSLAVGTHTLTLIVTDKFGLSNQDEVHITIKPFGTIRKIESAIEVELVMSTYWSIPNHTFHFLEKNIGTNSNGEIYIYGIIQNYQKGQDQTSEIGELGGASDLYVAKLDAEGTRVLWTTVLGGSSSDHAGKNALIITPDDRIIIGGSTQSSDFPVTPDAFQRHLKGQTDGFVVRLSTSGEFVEKSTYFGGDGAELLNALTIDNQMNIYLGGASTSNNLPGAVNDYQGDTFKGHGFLANIHQDTGEVFYSRYIAGPINHDVLFGDAIESIFIDSSQILHFLGVVHSQVEVTQDAYDNTYNGDADIYYGKLDNNGNLIYGTFFGGSHRDNPGNSFDIDGEGNVYIVGGSNSEDFPLANPHPTTNSRENDGVFLRLNSRGIPTDSFAVSGSRSDWLTDLKINDVGQIIVLGDTTSSDVETTTPTMREVGNSDEALLDAFFQIYDINGDLLYSSYFGGSTLNYFHDFTIDNNGDIVAIGGTDSTDFPVTSGVYKESKGTAHHFVSKFSMGHGELMAGPTDSNPTEKKTKFWVDAGENINTLMRQVNSHRRLGLAVLEGSAWDDDQLLDEVDRLSWSLEGCNKDPCGEISIGHPNLFRTGVNMAEPGIYTFVFSAEKDQQNASDSVTVTVGSSFPDTDPGIGKSEDPSPAFSQTDLRVKFSPEQKEKGEIEFFLETEGWVSAVIEDRNRIVVRHLLNRRFSAGHHTVEWDGLFDNQRDMVPSGFYNVVVVTPEKTFKSKLVVSK